MELLNIIIERLKLDNRKFRFDGKKYIFDVCPFCKAKRKFEVRNDFKNLRKTYFTYFEKDIFYFCKKCKEYGGPMDFLRKTGMDVIEAYKYIEEYRSFRNIGFKLIDDQLLIYSLSCRDIFFDSSVLL